MCVCVYHSRLVDPFLNYTTVAVFLGVFSVLRLNEFFKLRISTNLLISQFLEMADDASQGRHLAAYGGLMQHVVFSFWKLICFFFQTANMIFLWMVSLFKC